MATMTKTQPPKCAAVFDDGVCVCVFDFGRFSLAVCMCVYAYERLN